MRRTAILTAAVGGLFASSAMAAITTSFTVTSVSSTLDQIDVYAFNTGGGTGTGLVAADISVNAATGSLSYWRSTSAGSPNVVNATETANRSFIRIDNEDAGSTSVVSRSPAGNWPLAPTVGANTVGIEDFGIAVASLTGAKPANAGTGALFLSLFVNKNYAATISGQLGGDTGSAQPFSFDVGPSTAPADSITVTPASVSVDVSPVGLEGFSGVAVSATGGNVALVGSVPAQIADNLVITGLGTPSASISGNGFTYGDLGTYVLTLTSGTDTETFTLTIVPEPASLSLIGLAGLGMIRRRK